MSHITLVLDWMHLIGNKIYFDCENYHSITIGGGSAKYHSVSQGGGGLEGVNFVSQDFKNMDVIK